MLASLSAIGFRNLGPFTWRPGEGRHLLLAGNGAGKTSLLEAAYVLATTRSFRTAHVADCCRHDADGFHLSGEVENERRWHLEVGWCRGKRVRTVDGSATTLSDHLATMPVVAWTAADSEILTGPPRPRRRMLDRGMIGLRPGTLEVLTRYRQALRQKSELLQHHGRGVEVWNELMAVAAAEIARLRGDYITRLGRALDTAIRESSLGFPPIEINYRPSPASALGGESAIAVSLARAIDAEHRRRQPLVGPHRDDVEVRWAGHEIRRVASAGERKALGLLLTAAQGRVLEAAGKAPLYLLDDVDAELSEDTLGAVWEVFAGARQLVASSNRRGPWAHLEVTQRWGLEGALPRPAEST